MRTNFTWKKQLLQSTYSIYSNNQLVGKLEDKTLAQKATGELNGERYTFNTKGFLKSSTEIVDVKDNKVIGVINYNSWKTQAVIKLRDKTIYCKCDNVWNTKWHIREPYLSI